MPLFKLNQYPTKKIIETKPLLIYGGRLLLFAVFVCNIDNNNAHLCAINVGKYAGESRASSLRSIFEHRKCGGWKYCARQNEPTSRLHRLAKRNAHGTSPSANLKKEARANCSRLIHLGWNLRASLHALVDASLFSAFEIERADVHGAVRKRDG